MKEEGVDPTLWRTGFGRSCGAVVRETGLWMNEWIAMQNHSRPWHMLYSLHMMYFCSRNLITRCVTTWLRTWRLALFIYISFPPFRHYFAPFSIPPPDVSGSHNAQLCYGMKGRRWEDTAVGYIGRLSVFGRWNFHAEPWRPTHLCSYIVFFVPPPTRK